MSLSKAARVVALCVDERHELVTQAAKRMSLEAPAALVPWYVSSQPVLYLLCSVKDAFAELHAKEGHVGGELNFTAGTSNFLLHQFQCLADVPSSTTAPHLLQSDLSLWHTQHRHFLGIFLFSFMPSNFIGTWQILHFGLRIDFSGPCPTAAPCAALLAASSDAKLPMQTPSSPKACHSSSLTTSLAENCGAAFFWPGSSKLAMLLARFVF